MKQATLLLAVLALALAGGIVLTTTGNTDQGYPLLAFALGLMTRTPWAALAKEQQ